MNIPPPIHLTRTQSADADDYFSLPLQRPALRLHRATQPVLSGHSARTQSAALRPLPAPAWEGSRTPHGMQIAPGAVDYFHSETAGRTSWRAMQNLTMVAGGRCLVSLGLAGIKQAYVRDGADSARPAPPPSVAGAFVPHDFHFALFVLGSLGAVAGLFVHTIGVGRFHHDTSKINRRRAHLVGTAATLGAFMIAGGGAYYDYALVERDADATWKALPLRALGNACVFFAIPASFSSSELVFGVTPIKNRILWRDLFFAGGGMSLIAWGQMSQGMRVAPLWAREVTQCVGIVMTALGGALPRVDAMHAQAAARLFSPAPTPAGAPALR